MIEIPKDMALIAVEPAEPMYCNGCCFGANLVCDLEGEERYCHAHERKDGKNVIFKLVELKNELDEIHGVILVMQNIIKGLDTPCELCVGCVVDKNDKSKGVCESFILKERIWEKQ